MPKRSEVYQAIDAERAHQDRRWNKDTTTTEGKHSVAEFVLFMEDYIVQARSQLTRNGDPVASALALDTVRKIAALSVVCMEQNGIVLRNQRDESFEPIQGDG
ncbi:MAG: hypothetical protein EOQ56_28205 [Mesorhizobium sp.]|nr:MAG: hypothetical protein EOQ56_28205 [Mesorhizobium sp.]